MFDQSMIFSEEAFEEAMENKIKPWVREHVKDGFLETSDGTKIHYVYGLHEKERGAIVISHGFCEFIKKYDEVMYYFYQMGYSVFMHEHRGHGYSDRVVEDLDKVYVKDYQEYVKDMDEFIDAIVKKKSVTGRLFLFAHSMGGCIAANYLEAYPDCFQAAVLSSPMLQMNFKKTPEWVVSLLALWSQIMKKDYEYIPGHHGFRRQPSFATSSCLSKLRYDYTFNHRLSDEHYTTCGSTYGWARASMKGVKRAIRNGKKVKTPILLFQAGLDSLVKPKGQIRFVAKTPQTKLVVYDESKHEIYSASDEIRRDYFERIFAFLGKYDNK